MKDTLIATLKEALSVRVEDITFSDNLYHDESFIAKSISNGFSGWYSDTDVAKHVDFVLKLCEVKPDSRILDAACGHGRHADLLSRKGHEVVGIDISQQLIWYLKKEYGNSIQFERRSFKDINYSATFDLAIVLGNSLSLIPRQEMQPALRNLSSSLKRGGRLFVELDNRDYFVKNEAGKKYWDYHRDRWLTLSEHHYDQANNLEKTLDVGIDLHSMEIDQFPLTKSLYDHKEISDLLSKVDLRKIKAFGNWDGSCVSDDSPSLLIVAEPA